MDQDSNVKYTLKLCSSSPETACGPNVAVCAQNLTSSKSQSVGKLEFSQENYMKGEVDDALEEKYNKIRPHPKVE